MIGVGVASLSGFDYSGSMAPTSGILPMKHMDGANVYIHINKDAAKAGEPCITVSHKRHGTEIARGAKVRLVGVWDVVQHDGPTSCGASVTLETSNGTWAVSRTL